MKLRHLKLVRAVAGVGTLTAAAKNLHLSQPALSHQLKEMQEEFGAPVFRRAGKRMLLTEVGKRILEGADAVLSELDRMESDVARLVSGEHGTLRIATACYTGYHWLPAILRSFKRCYPRVDVKVALEATRNPIEHMLNGRLDLAILNTRGAEPSIAYKKLFDDEMLVLVPRDHPWTRRKHVDPEAFARETLINYDLPDAEIFFLQEILRPAGVTPSAVMRLPTTDAMVEMVKAGMGVAVLVEWALRPYLRSPRIKALRLTRRGVKRPWYVATLRTDHPPPYIPKFIEHLSKHAGR